MINGIGIDIVSINRVSEKIGNVAFKNKVFSQNEINYCESCSTKEQHYAVRFAAKEAFLKATGKGLTAGYNLHDIEVVNDHNGKPFIQLHQNFNELSKAEGWQTIHLSLSHEGDQALAMVIIEK